LNLKKFRGKKGKERFNMGGGNVGYLKNIVKKGESRQESQEEIKRSGEKSPLGECRPRQGEKPALDPLQVRTDHCTEVTPANEYVKGGTTSTRGEWKGGKEEDGRHGKKIGLDQHP